LYFRDGLVLVYRKLTAVGDQCWMVLLSWLSITALLLSWRVVC